MKTVFSILAIALAVLLVGCPQPKTLGTPSHANVVINKTGTYDFNKNRARLSISKKSNDFVIYQISFAKEGDEVLKPNSGFGIGNDTSEGFDPKFPWFFYIVEEPLVILACDGNNVLYAHVFVDENGHFTDSDKGKLDFLPYSDLPDSCKNKILPSFFEALPEPVREQIKSANSTAASQN